MNDNKLNELESRIRNSAQDGQPVKTQLKTSERIIARVTDGIYREPWAAFRELIANAYDADATEVIIETDAPRFAQITVRDNGIGMSPKTLAYVLQHIGGSSKRLPIGIDLNTTHQSEPDRSPAGRPLIGKTGIGLFAIAQLTQHFQIITKANGDAIRTSATVTLQTHQENVPEHEYIAGTVTIRSETVLDSEIQSQGTTVVLYELRPQVRKVMRSSRRWEPPLLTEDTPDAARKPSHHIGYSPDTDETNPNIEPRYPWQGSDGPDERFRAILEAANQSSRSTTKSADLDHFDEYLKLLWKLSLSLPMDYVDGHPFDLTGSSGVIMFGIPAGMNQAKKVVLPDDEPIRKHLRLTAGKDLHSNVFSVTIDGIALRRPVRLPTQLVKNSRIKAPVMMVSKVVDAFATDHLDRAGGNLSFEGYLYWNSKVVPKETAGVLIRIREASGTLFDPTFLNYQVSEQTRLRQITAEVFVHEGLDSALNIDRESFNYSHPHLLYIQRWLHRALRLLVNRLKAMANEDLQRERATQRGKVQADRVALAQGVWHRRYGADSDTPVQDTEFQKVVTEVGDVDIDWSDFPDITEDPGTITALSIVLEAYGALSALPVADRASLINDVIQLFKAR